MYVGRVAGWIGIFEGDLVVITILRCGDALGSEARGVHVAFQRCASAAAGSGSDAGADAGGSRLQAVVRQRGRAYCRASG